MALLGRVSWWLPGWLDRLLPHPEGRPAAAAAPVEPELIKV